MYYKTMYSIEKWILKYHSEELDNKHIDVSLLYNEKYLVSNNVNLT